MASSLPNIKFVLVNTIEPIDIQVTDGSGIATDAAILRVSIMDLGGNIMWTDDVSNVGTNIIKVGGQTGYYYYPFGTPLSPALGLPAINTQTNTPQQYLFQWTVQAIGGSVATALQNVNVVPPIVMAQLPYFRLMIDKSRKLVDPANDVFLGYTDAQLMMYLEGGMQIINAYQPESVCFSTQTFPWHAFRHIGLEASLMAGVLSQELFAMDTDIPNYSDQGTAFVIAHQPQLAATLNSVTQRLDKAIPMMKLQFVSTGSIHMTMGPSFKLAQLIQAAPNGSLFRNLFYRG